MSSNSLDKHFQSSSFFDETFCHHRYKTVGSKIYSNGLMEQEKLNFESQNSIQSNKLKSVDLNYASSDSEAWGWYEFEESSPHDHLLEEENPNHHKEKACEERNHNSVITNPVAKEVPTYVLTETLSSQKLWHQTAGKRPRQPEWEREYYEEKWKQNFVQSSVDYSKPLPKKKHDKREKIILHRAASPFGSAVSKSFKCEHCMEISSIMVHIPKFQIVKCGNDVHAEYLIVVGLGAVTLGVWRRFQDFRNLANKLSKSGKRSQFQNTLCSWYCLRARQRFFRCLDKDYLILKCFLLERFLHDLVFESISPDTVREFLGVL
mmetsp:Transcript_16329/g.24206  ORF Transcript_16329/g.24206 Transcript_16329/m.24206 type:complete len:320 (-) Transcript_16329:79-1038(-)